MVFGVGNPDADLVFVGEAPGRDEDRQDDGPLLREAIGNLVSNASKYTPEGGAYHSSDYKFPARIQYHC